MDKSKEILMLFKENEERAFRELFNSFYDNLLLYAIQFLNDSETAKDVVQDCFVDFYVNKRFNFIRIGLEQYSKPSNIVPLITSEVNNAENIAIK